jgi:hypothetical protein
MKSTSIVTALIAALLFAVSLAHATAGTPISSVPVGLDHDPGGNLVAESKTDAKGNATFGKLAPGRYVVFVPDLSIFKGPVVFAVSVNGSAPVLSEPIKAGKGKAYAMDKNGRKLMPTIDKAGGQIVVTIFDRWGI